LCNMSRRHAPGLQAGCHHNSPMCRRKIRSFARDFCARRAPLPSLTPSPNRQHYDYVETLDRAPRYMSWNVAARTCFTCSCRWAPCREAIPPHRHSMGGGVARATHRQHRHRDIFKPAHDRDHQQRTPGGQCSVGLAKQMRTSPIGQECLHPAQRRDQRGACTVGTPLIYVAEQAKTRRLTPSTAPVLAGRVLYENE